MGSGGHATAGEVVLAYVAEQVATIRDRESGVGSVDQDAIHKTRVATRRLRSVLSSYRRLLHRERTEPLRDELKWLAAVLGEVRDMHVLREHLDQEAADVLGLGGLPEGVDRELTSREEAAARELHAALDSVRYADLRQVLDALVERPPLRRRAGRSADRVLPALAGRAAQLVDDAAALADAPDVSPHERNEHLHSVRKAAKRARYAAELALPVGGKRAALLVQRMTELQEVLGRHQDSVMSRQVLAELAAPAAAAGSAESAYAVGMLAGAEQADDVAALAAYGKALKRTRGKARRWTARGGDGADLAAPLDEADTRGPAASS